MTSRQKQLVRESFFTIRETAGPLSMLFFGRLFQLDPALRPMFHQDLRLQGRKLMDMLIAVVDSLDHFQELDAMLRALGQRHAGYGVRPEHYATVTTALLWALGQALDMEFYPEVRAAWLTVIDAISDRMQAGAAGLPSP